MFRGDRSRAQKLENRWNCLNSFVNIIPSSCELNGKIEVLILGVCLKIFFFFEQKSGQKLGCVLHRGVHFTWVNMVYCFHGIIIIFL